MCKEFITIALCAPAKAPSLSFTCGRFHMVASKRNVCDRARGACVCFFGTCGMIEKITETMGIDLSSVSKVRCAECTMREDNVGDRRTPQQVIDSPLLQRIAIDPRDDFVSKKHSAMLRDLWGNKASCPFHVGRDNSNPVPVAAPAINDDRNNNSSQRPFTPKSQDEPASNSASMSRDTVDNGWSSPGGTSSPKEKASRKSNTSPTGIASVDSLVGLKSSRWATAPKDPVKRPMTKQPSPQQKQFSPRQPSPQQKQFSPQQRRAPTPPAAAPVFIPNPTNTVKVRDATKKIADMKSFLAGVRVR